MKVTTKGRYGLKAMIDIAVYGEDGQISLKNIAARQNISEAYLEQLISVLKKVGVVKSTRGSKGGYRLGMDADEIKIGTILRALEGTFSPMSCDSDNTNCPDDCECCAAKSVWLKMENSLNEAADSITLKELAEDYKKLNNIL